MKGGIKRKLNLQSIENKYLAIKEVENGANRKDVCEKFSVKHNTLSGWQTILRSTPFLPFRIYTDTTTSDQYPM